MFQLRDTRARGLKRWFSIVVLMKDKMFLLNITPVLSEHMQKIAKELQDLADIVYNEEQKVCSQRALRLRTGRNDFGQSRSLIQLTGEENIFKKLHSHFTYMLKAGALVYSETQYTSLDLLQKLNPKTDKGIFEANACSVKEEGMPLRAIENLLSKPVFRVLMYCILTGTHIIIKPTNTNVAYLIKGLARLLPISENENIPNLRTTVENVVPSAGLCIIEEMENSNFCYKWPGILPIKCPTIINRIEGAIENPKFNDTVLHQYVMSLNLEWLGIAKAVKSATEASGAKSEAITRLKQALGVSPQDDLLVNFWISTYCN
ncbi:folliculin [Hyposmocoma kahamanoa]|uniref:folliculin n=1 Tax=Hyposmocoma kahamanoa TaxID=1477025 RepID=UPI000E6D63D3|nr:folliculin [Hyposmocoma kahamanoa]